MQDKKDLILNKCRDLIYEAAFKMPYDKVKMIYADYQIKQRLDKFLTDLIERGEFFYGDNFTKDFVSEKTDKARRWLLNDIMYGNGIDVELPENKPVISSDKEEKTKAVTDNKTVDNQSMDKKGNDDLTEKIEVEEPKEVLKQNYDDFKAYNNIGKWTSLEEKNDFINTYNELIANFDKYISENLSLKFPDKHFDNIARIYRDKVFELETLFSQNGENFFATSAGMNNVLQMYINNYIFDKIVTALDIVKSMDSPETDKYKALAEYESLCQEAKNFTFDNTIKDVIISGFRDDRYYIFTPGTYTENYKKIKETLNGLGKNNIVSELDGILLPIIEEQEKKSLEFAKEQTETTSSLDVAEPKEEMTYEELFDNLTKDCAWPEEAANRFIMEYINDENIKSQAREALDAMTKPLEMVTEDSLKDDTQELPKVDEPIPVKTKDPNPGLIEKFKEKWQDPKFKRKVIIGGIVVAIGAIGAMAVAISPELQQFFGGLANNVTNLFTGDEVMHVTEATNVASGVDASSIDTSTLDTSSWNMEGFNVYDSANEAVNGINAESANQWFSSDIQGLYDTSTGQMLNLSPEDLQNADYIKDLLSSNENISAVFGDGQINTLNDVSGFVNGDDVVNLIEQGKVR